MSEISRTALFGKLNALAYKAIEGATVFCKMRGNPYVELEHWFAQLLQQQDSDLHRVIQHYGLDISAIAKDMTAALDRLPRGATAISDFSPHIENAIERAWTYATLQFGEAQVRTGYLLVGMLKTPSLRNPLLGLSRQFEKVKVEDLADNFAKICDPSPESRMRAQDGTGMGSGAPGEDAGAMAPAAMGKGDALKKFAVDLTEKARKGEMDPVTGRDEEIRQIVDILMRRRQNNPLLTGEAGVGKTAVVEGFAQRLARGDVPPQLREVKLLTLDIGLLQAGASMKGEFEQRLRQVIDEVQASPTPIILFIDEIHTLVGAGGAAGTGDAANLLKPALARGNLRTIGATTWAEYKKYIEKDPALTRRFQVVQVPEPDETKAILMLRGVASVLEKHHRVQLLDEAIEAAVKLSHRYIPARQLPDKAVSLLDTACARVAVSQHATPPEVEDCQRRIEALTVEQEIIGREEAIGIDVGKRSAQVQSLLAEAKDQLEKLDARWKEEKGLVDRLLELRGKLREGNKAVDEATAEGAAPDRTALLAQLHELQGQISRIQGESPLILPSVDSQAVSSVVADWTGIPVGRMQRNEIETVLKLPALLGQRVIGQDHAMEMIAKRIQTARAGLDNPGKPIGVFMLAGTSGVGKTETAIALAEALYGGEQNMIVINMSEYQEAHTVSSLKGAPPGYVGYGEGGVLTEAVRRRPYSVVLLDEVEKAHPDVHELFFQVFDKGFMEDGEGRSIDFKNTLILLTTNAGTELIASLCKDPELMPDPEGMAKALREPLLKIFPPALLGRLVTIPYYPLSDEMLGKIVELQLKRIKKRVEARYQIPFEYGNDVVKLVVSRCTESESGGRMIDAILTNTMLPDISREFLNRMMEGRPIERVQVRVAEGQFAYGF
ncbi:MULTISPECIES: type VI secretion system ATPase TssH [unclassified Variovorax]|uniref:type VI secretion system ATPase TssH n=1 Tax=unclassified Variovorax TaxID=663243 RepID=UPI00076CFDF3|nr:MULTISPECIES: type VI secretion system ATPase TssH [unclassified Variovorax]KWT92958.1 ClpB protein [Variovorax sp. WDL1]PNG51909.1 Chaperone protein ClpB [Variovorax sp. B2]PNG54256.1 Chaperone protein ClpB [Variovorax sp. B4]VTV11744.1 Chaperone protein ClpB [Variovorax sp. WDL1]